MTLEQVNKESYVKSPNSCPYCGDEDIVAFKFTPDDNQAWRPVFCLTCRKEWHEIYTITDIEEINHDIS